MKSSKRSIHNNMVEQRISRKKNNRQHKIEIARSSKRRSKGSKTGNKYLFIKVKDVQNKAKIETDVYIYEKLIAGVLLHNELDKV